MLMTMSQYKSGIVFTVAICIGSILLAILKPFRTVNTERYIAMLN